MRGPARTFFFMRNHIAGAPLVWALLTTAREWEHDVAVWCGALLRAFAADRNRKGHVWLRWFNEVPVVILFATVLLVVLNPF